jgi:excisionase family DNA binding protein
VADPAPRPPGGPRRARPLDLEGPLGCLATRVIQVPREDLPALVAELGALEAECQRLRALAWNRLLSTTIEERLHSVRDLATRWGLSRQRVYELIQAGTLPAIKIDRTLRVRHRAVLAFEQARETGWHETSLSVRIDSCPSVGGPR